MSDNTSFLVFALSIFLGLPVLLGVGIGLAAIGSAIGNALEHHRERKDAKLAHRRQLELEAARRHAAPKNATVCGCEHDLAFHNRDTGVCHHKAHGEQCSCQQYTGPQPLPEFFAPEIVSDMNGA
jgi:hypothetical protein